MKKMKNTISYPTIIQLLFFVIFSCKGTNEQPATLPDNLLSDPAAKASCVFMATDPNGIPAVSWIEENKDTDPKMFFAVWLEDTQKFGDKKEIPIPPNVSVHEEGMPKIAFKADGTMLTTYESSTPSETRKWGISDLSFMESHDRGNTWTAAKSVFRNKYEGSSPNFSGLNRLSDGEIGVAWLDNNSDQRIKSRPLMFAKTSKDGGFNDAVEVTSKSCECCRIAVAGDQDGQILIAFRNLTEDEVRDISMSISADGGLNFSTPEDLSQDHWIVDGCPHNGSALAVGNGKRCLSWFTGAEGKEGVYYAEFDKDGKNLRKELLSQDGQFAQIALTADGIPLIAFSEYYEKDEKTRMRINLAKAIDSGFKIIQLSDSEKDANHPVIQMLNDGSAIVGWTEDGKAVYKKVSLNDFD